MKGLCYLMVLLVIVMLFSKSPLVGMVLVGTFLVIWLFLKIRKRNARGSSNKLLLGSRTIQKTQPVNDFITFMMIQQIFDSSIDKNHVETQPNIKTRSIKGDKVSMDRKRLIERQKQEILKLLEG
jgi:hypothetical protein